MVEFSIVDICDSMATIQSKKMKKYILLSMISIFFIQIAYTQTNQTINNLMTLAKAYAYE